MRKKLKGKNNFFRGAKAEAVFVGQSVGWLVGYLSVTQMFDEPHGAATLSIWPCLLHKLYPLASTWGHKLSN